MRIISGNAKGLRLHSPPGKGQSIRPTSDRCREALFSIIHKHIQGASVLDLFSGTGALGLEAMSRGARCALFVDKQPLALQLIKKNIETYEQCLNSPSALTADAFMVLQRDLRKGLGFLKKCQDPTEVPFDIIFVDPPYAKGCAQQMLKELDHHHQFLHQDGVLVIEESTKILLPSELKHLMKVDSRIYGDTAFWFYNLK